MPVFDNLLMLFDGDTVTATTTSSAVKIFGTGVKGAAVRAVFNNVSGTNPAVTPEVQASKDGTNYYTVAAHPEGELALTSEGKEIIVPFTVDADVKYIKLKLTVTGTSPSFDVYAGIVTNVGYDWQRKSNFE